MSKKTLDLGCNDRPRNPYNHQEVYGIDLMPLELEGITYFQANLSLQPIPFPDNYFDCVSAFDFIEHVPRQLLSLDTGQTRLPFIELMNEIWRVLKPGGIFYAVTPAYPSAVAFQDPTHVNFITKRTHEYFCGNSPGANTYGFVGRFEALRVEFVVPKIALTANRSMGKFLYRLSKRILSPHRLSHILWELKARK